MSVTVFDGNFSFKQEELARMGGREISQMTKEQWLEFQDSPFMKGMKKADQLCYEKTMERDEKRKERDEEFEPADTDWTAEKTFDYEKSVNYYKVLGVDDLASLEQIKQAYKKLSLIYHPDKTAGMTEREKDSHNEVFIELKNAYRTLADKPTRRQYDRERDRDFAIQDVNGWKPKVKKAFDATEVLKKLSESSKNPGKIVEISVVVRLEKFVWGGAKGIQRERQVKDFVGFTTESKLFRLDIPGGAPEKYEVEFKHAGDHQEDARPDTLKFCISPKPHETVRREGDDLFSIRKVVMRPDAHIQPYLSGQVEGVRGQHVVFWGRNPFFRTTGSGGGDLKFRIQGAGVGPQGHLNFTARLDAAANTEGAVVVRMKQQTTGAWLVLRVPQKSTMGDLKARARELLDFLGNQNIKIMKSVAGGQAAYPDEQPLGTLRALEVGGTQFSEVSLSYDGAVSFLYVVVGICETDAFQVSLADAYRLASASRSKAEEQIDEIWEKVYGVLPDYGFDQTEKNMKETIAKAVDMVEGDSDLAFLCAKAKTLVVGFDPDAYAEKGKSIRKPTCVAAHPSMVSRIEDRLTSTPVCRVELVPVSEPISLSTQPPCSLTFYSNAWQPAGAPSGEMKPRLMFAVSIACAAGSKKAGMEEWSKLKGGLAPLIENSFFYMLRSARGILPKALCPAAHFPDGDYLVGEDIIVTQMGEEPPQEEEIEEEDDDDDEDDAAEDDEDDDGGGGGMFDFDDSDDDDEAKLEKKAAKDAKKQKKRDMRRAVRMIMNRDNKAEAKRKEAAERAAAKSPGPAESVPMPWKRMADAAFKFGDFFTAINYFSSQLLGLQDTDDNEAKAAAMCDRSGCLAMVRHFDAALADAKTATELKDQWGGSWRALGVAASQCGPELADEACGAFVKAVQFEPIVPNCEGLLGATKTAKSPNVDGAVEAKDKGNEAVKASDLGLAIAQYTLALGQVPEEPGDEDSNTVLKANILSNRSLAFSKLKMWDAAVRDGETAVGTCGTHARARFRLGTALLGVGQTEKAYAEFAMGLKLSPDDEQLKKAREACLSLLPLWRSVPAMARFRSRFSMDQHRPKASTKVFVMSDLHFDHKKNDEWVTNIDEFMFQDDVLIVAGNIGDALASVIRCLRALKMKFRRVFFTPGNHEAWVHPSERSRFADSFAKIFAVLAACDELGVDVFPAYIAEDCFVVPLFSWYNFSYDEADPFPDPKLAFDAHTSFPVSQYDVWQYFLDLNRSHLQLPYHDTVITFSHFLPRWGLPFDKNVPKVAKATGCLELDEQIRPLKSKLHIYGHARKRYAQAQDNVMYLTHSLGYENEHTDREPIMCAFNGQNVCQRIVPIQNEKNVMSPSL